MCLDILPPTITRMLAVYTRLCVAHNSLRDGQWLKWELRTGCYELWQKTVVSLGEETSVGTTRCSGWTTSWRCPTTAAEPWIP